MDYITPEQEDKLKQFDSMPSIKNDLRNKMVEENKKNGITGSSSIEATSAGPAPISTQTPLGPVLAPSSNPTPATPTPAGDNSPPPAITNATPATKKEGITFQQFFISILFLVLTGAAIYYGWTLGQLEGRGYLLYVQSFGSWLRSWFVKPTPSV